MPILIQMPKLGHTMTEGKVLHWHKREGEPVREGEPILTVETDKTEVEIDSPGTGVLARLAVAEGTVVPVGQTLALIAAPGETLVAEARQSVGAEQVGVAPRPAPRAPDAGAAATASSTRPAPTRRVLATPRAKRLAAEHGLELASVPGHGADGAVTEDDVRAALAAGAAAPPASAAPAPPAAPGPLQPARREKLTRIQALGARNLAASWREIPHFVQMVRVDMSRTVAARKALNASGASCSITDLILAATVKALKLNPRVNASFGDGEMLIYDRVNLGIAVDTPEGLVVPVIHDADRAELSALSARVAELAAKARAKKLSPAELEGATFTVSNLGAFGVENGTPVIFAPQAALMFVGAIRDEVLAVSGRPEVRPAMQIAIAYDHRGIDGATAARFTTKVKELLEIGAFAAAAAEAPAAALRPREVTVDYVGEGLRTRVGYGALSWELSGDDHSAPDPVTSFLGALGSCLLMSLKVAARARNFKLDGASAVARCNEKGRVEEIDVELRIASGESDDKLSRLVEVAERGCHVKELIREGVPVRLHVVREGSGR